MEWLRTTYKMFLSVKMSACLLEGNFLLSLYPLLIPELKHLYLTLYIYSAPSFYLPTDPTRPIVLVGPGTGIAPFVAFWQHRKAQVAAKVKLGRCWLFFGCRQKELDLYHIEKQLMVENKIIDRNFLALSRENGLKKVKINFIITTKFKKKSFS